MAPRPPYVDPQTNVSYDTNGANFEGYLTKQSEWLKDWRRRYFILKGSKLFYTKTESTAPHGMIDLSACMTVKSAELKAGKKNAFEISTKESTYFMFADSEKEKDEWIGAVGRAIVQASATFTGDNQEDDDEGSEDSDYE